MATLILLLNNILSEKIVYAVETPPIIINQVELGSALQESNGKVVCSKFLGGGTCELLHVWSSSNHTCNGLPPPFSSGPQWFDLYNTLNTTAHLQSFDVRTFMNQRLTSESGPSSNVIEIGPHERCTFAYMPVDMALTLEQSNMSIAIQYSYNKQNYTFSTPFLTDLYNDTRTWQFDGTQWTFAEQNTVPVPEFPFAIPVLIISITSLIVFYRIHSK